VVYIMLCIIYVVYYVDSEGSCISGDSFCVGSGAHSAYSILDSTNIDSSNTAEEAVEYALWAVRHATFRDGYSGGYINVVQVNATGIFPLMRVDSRTLKLRE
jgi:20S proteasome subunit beta 5